MIEYYLKIIYDYTEVIRLDLKEIIFEKRNQLNLSQEQLAEKLNVARQTISKWETGSTLPDIESLKRLAEILNFSIDDALGINIEKDDESDDNFEWLIIGGFVIGNALGLVFNNLILGYVFAMIGLGISYCFNAFKKQ